MNKKQRGTLEAIFKEPTLSNVKWSDREWLSGTRSTQRSQIGISPATSTKRNR